MKEPDEGQLLRAFDFQGDETAFAELMRRHGGVVRAAAINVTGSTSMADDIAQAAFLALARKAGSFDPNKGSVAGWLYRVATRLACDACRSDVRRKAREAEASMVEFSERADTRTTLGEAALAALCEELGNLAEKYRQAVILHHLEGLSYEAAAPLCGCTATTFGMRLTRGREKLRERLTKRGVTLGVAALVAGLGESAASAAPLSEALVTATCKAAVGISAGGSAAVVGGGLISAKVASLTDSALKMLFWGQLKTVAVVCATAAVVGAGGVGVTLSVMNSRPDQVESKPATIAAVAPAVDDRASEDGAILFQDSFENGLGKWNQFAPPAKSPDGGANSRTADIRVVTCQRDGRPITAAELVGRAPNGQPVGIAIKPLDRTSDAYVITYEYTYEGRPRKAMEGLDLDLAGPSPAYAKPARPAGEWNQVRWECERKVPARGAATLDARLYFNGEYLGSKEYVAESSEIGFALTVMDGQFRFANVVIREIKK